YTGGPMPRSNARSSHPSKRPDTSPTRGKRSSPILSPRAPRRRSSKSPASRCRSPPTGSARPTSAGSPPPYGACPGANDQAGKNAGGNQCDASGSSDSSFLYESSCDAHTKDLHTNDVTDVTGVTQGEMSKEREIRVFRVPSRTNVPF